MITTYFVRHAMSDSTIKDDKIRPLTPQGLEAAQKLVSKFGGINIDNIYSSPYKRAIDTVLPLAQSRNLDIHIIDDFKERKRDSIQTIEKHELTLKQWRDFAYTLSDGECFNDVQIRNINALNKVIIDSTIDNRDRNIVIGTHGVALCTIFHYYKPISEIEFEHILSQMPYVAVMRFELDKFIDVAEM